MIKLYWNSIAKVAWFHFNLKRLISAMMIIFIKTLLLNLILLNIYKTFLLEIRSININLTDKI